jgi:hypothetical protein
MMNVARTIIKLPGDNFWPIVTNILVVTNNRYRCVQDIQSRTMNFRLGWRSFSIFLYRHKACVTASTPMECSEIPV